MPAEWENPSLILMALPSAASDWNYILPEAMDQYYRLLSALLEAGEKVLLLAADEDLKVFRNKFPQVTSVSPEKLRVVTDVAYNDTWTRDYGPLTIEVDGALRELDFGFNGWGLKFASNYDNLVNLNLSQAGVLRSDRYVNCRAFTLEGGSIESDGKGTVLTTSRCLCSPNRNGGKDKREIEEILRLWIGAERVLWLDYGFLEGDDTDSHVDTLARLCPDNTIVYVAPPEDAGDVHYAELSLMEEQLRSFRTAEGRPYRLIPLPFPDPIFDEEGNRLPATYANYLVTGKNLFIPLYGQAAKDAEAVRRIHSAFPSHRTFTTDCNTLIKQHGSLHCSTMQLYETL